MKLVTVADIHGNHDSPQGLAEDYNELWRCRSRAISRMASSPSSERVLRANE